jgi:hypothetical protein
VAAAFAGLFAREEELRTLAHHEPDIAVVAGTPED